MKKPKYIEELLKIIFLAIGMGFVCFSVLGYIGVVKPTSHSKVQDSGLISISFGIVGIIFILAGKVLSIITARKNKKHLDLLRNGIRIEGIVENVYLQSYIQFGNQSPYIIQYTYTYQEKEYHSKSSFIWEKPNLIAGDTIMVYVDDFGKSTVL